MGDEVKRRPYRSALRASQARETRRGIVDAATRMFVERGYAATSIDAIAEAAGVSRATVFTAVGGKSELLRRAYDFALVGDDEPVALPERAWANEVRAAGTQVVAIERYAKGITDYGGRVAAIYEAYRGAAAVEPDVRSSWQEIRAERRTGARNFVRVLSGLGPLRRGVDARTAADVVWVLNDPGLYHQLVVEQSWSAVKFSSWLTEAMKAQISGEA